MDEITGNEGLILPEMSKYIVKDFKMLSKYIKKIYEHAIEDLDIYKIDRLPKNEDVLEKLYDIYIINYELFGKVRAFVSITEDLVTDINIKKLKLNGEELNAFYSNKYDILDELKNVVSMHYDYMFDISNRIGYILNELSIVPEEIKNVIMEIEERVAIAELNGFEELNSEYFELKRKVSTYNTFIELYKIYKLEEERFRKIRLESIRGSYELKELSAESIEEGQDVVKEIMDIIKKEEESSSAIENLKEINSEIEIKVDEMKKELLNSKEPTELFNEYYTNKAYKELIDEKLKDKVLAIINYYKTEFDLYGTQSLKSNIKSLGGSYLYNNASDNIIFELNKLSKSIEKMVKPYRFKYIDKLRSKFNLGESLEELKKEYYLSKEQMRYSAGLGNLNAKENIRNNSKLKSDQEDDELNYEEKFFLGMKSIDYDYIKEELESLDTYSRLTEELKEKIESLFLSNRVYVNFASSAPSEHYSIEDGYIIVNSDDKRKIFRELGNFIEYSIIGEYAETTSYRKVPGIFANIMEIDYIKSYIDNSKNYNNDDNRKEYIIRYVLYMHDRIVKYIRELNFNNKIAKLSAKEIRKGKKLSEEEVNKFIDSLTEIEKYELMRKDSITEPYELLEEIVSWYISVNLEIKIEKDKDNKYITPEKYINAINLNMFNDVEDLTKYLDLDLLEKSSHVIITCELFLFKIKLLIFTITI